MKEKFLLFLILGLINISSISFSQTHLPAQIDAKLNDCYTKKICPNDLKFLLINEWFLPAEQSKTYGIFAFKFEKPLVKQKKEQEESSPVSELTYHVYLRIIKKAENSIEVIQEYNSQIPNIEAPSDFFTFAFPLNPDKYTIEIALSSNDFSQNSITIISKEFPALVSANKISFSTPIFVKEMKKLEQIDTIFTIWKNCFHYASAEIYPYIENKFSSSDKPTLLILRLFGMMQDKETQAFKYEYTIVIKKDDKEIIKFKPVASNAPGILQPLVFTKDNKEIDKGNYILILIIKDLVSEKEVSFPINFSII